MLCIMYVRVKPQPEVMTSTRFCSVEEQTGSSSQTLHCDNSTRTYKTDTTENTGAQLWCTGHLLRDMSRKRRRRKSRYPGRGALLSPGHIERQQVETADRLMQERCSTSSRNKSGRIKDPDYTPRADPLWTPGRWLGHPSPVLVVAGSTDIET